MSDDFVAAVSGVAALADPVRRRLYLHVAAAGGAVSREQAAAACGLPVHTAKFHLERLAAEGLLDVEFRRLTGRTGPGAGRPAKLYRRAAAEVSVSLPGRSYDLAADLLATAAERAVASGRPVPEELAAVARDHGRRAAARVARTDGTPAADAGGTRRDAELRHVAAVLAEEDYEPHRVDDELRLRNCPFASLAERHTELVCGMNLALVGGVVEEAGCREVAAHLRPHSEHCCVRVRGARAATRGHALDG